MSNEADYSPGQPELSKSTEPETASTSAPKADRAKAKQEQARLQVEVFKCGESPAYFINTYCKIYSAVDGGWVPFTLWPAQLETLDTIHNNRLVSILKARQLGQTWLALSYALWTMLFRSAATVLMFSRRDDEAVDLLKHRLRGMYRRLPEFLQVKELSVDNDHELELSNGSRAKAFPTTAGDSYTASLVIVDEADLVPNLSELMASVKPTIDGGGKMVLLSRPDKSRPMSPFKQIYRAARAGENSWTAVFLPWFAHPKRDAAWYEEQRADILSRTGAVDDLHEQYPASEAEALSPRQLDKRLPSEWLLSCYVPQRPLVRENTPALHWPPLPGLIVYAVPRIGRRDALAADPAEGNPNSDDSALDVLDIDTGEQVCTLAGRYEVTTFAAIVDIVGRWYGVAGVLPERNNHGHALIAWLHDNSPLQLMAGLDGRAGWLTTSKSKSVLYDTAADMFRDREAKIHELSTFSQLASISGSTLAPPMDNPTTRRFPLCWA